MRKTSRGTINARVIIVVAAVVVAAVIGGIILLDSPAQERLRRLDERRVADLRELAYALDLFWTREGRLPASLEEISNEPGVVEQLFDPETGRPYDYRVLSDNTYELCAQFSHDTAEEQERFYRDYYWSHGPGRKCFQLEAQAVKRPLEDRSPDGADNG